MVISPTQNIELTDAPVALEDSLNLTDGSDYLCENVGVFSSDAVASLVVASNQPGTDEPAHRLAPYDSLTLQVRSGFKTWAWSVSAPVVLVLTELA